MGDFQAIDVGLGLMFIYLVLSLVCTGINEFLAGIFQRRRRNLVKGLKFILTHDDHSNLVRDFKAHPLIQSLYGKKFQTSYIPPKVFSSVLVDLLHPGDSRTSTTLDDIRNKIDPPKGSANPQTTSTLYQTLKLLTKESENDLTKLKAKIEEWYNEAMVGTSGRFRMRTQAIVFTIAVAVAFAANADTFTLVQTLSQDSNIRSALVNQAARFGENAPVTQQAKLPTDAPGGHKDSANSTPGETADAAIPPLTLNDLEKSGLQLGWETFPPPTEELGFKKFMGLMITAIAISLGAPFWFDLLKKVANVRAGSLSPDEVEKEKKKDP